MASDRIRTSTSTATPARRWSSTPACSAASPPSARSPISALTDSPDADRIMHGMLETDAGYTIMAADVTSDMGYHAPAGFSVSVSGDDADALRGYWEKLSAGGTADDADAEAGLGRRVRHVRRPVRRLLAGRHHRGVPSTPAAAHSRGSRAAHRGHARTPWLRRPRPGLGAPCCSPRLSTSWPDLPLADRFERAARTGFGAVELARSPTPGSA